MNLEIVDKDGNPPAHFNQRLYDRNTGRVVQKGLPQAVSMWPAPTSQNAKHGAPTEWEQAMRPSHANVMASWATPTARDWKDGGSPAEFRRNSLPLTTQALSAAWSTPNAADSVGTHGGGQGRSLRTDTHGMGGKLNPSFVELLMGFPPGWSNPDGLLVLANRSAPTNRRAWYPTHLIEQRVSRRSATRVSHNRSIRSRSPFESGSKRKIAPKVGRPKRVS